MQTPNDVIATLLARLDCFDNEYLGHLDAHGRSYYDDSQAVIDEFRTMLQNYEANNQNVTAFLFDAWNYTDEQLSQMVQHSTGVDTRASGVDGKSAILLGAEHVSEFATFLDDLKVDYATKDMTVRSS